MPEAAARAGRRRRYVLEENIGFVLRQVTQRHLALFSEGMPEPLTPTQFAAVNKLLSCGPCSQNRLGRLTAMDAATIKGVVDRLTLRGITRTQADPGDARLLVVSLTPDGAAMAERATAAAARITERTLAPLRPEERSVLLDLLGKLR